MRRRLLNAFWSIFSNCLNLSVLRILFVACWAVVSDAQWPSYEAVSQRLPGKCRQGEFDCGFGSKCIPFSKFRDGRVDCLDASDEFCFIGQLKCGTICVKLEDLGECLPNPNCGNLTKLPNFCPYLKTKLCEFEDALPCKGYGECVLRKWLINGEKDCYDGSDEDEEYVRLVTSCMFTAAPIVETATAMTPDDANQKLIANQPATSILDDFFNVQTIGGEGSPWTSDAAVFPGSPKTIPAPFIPQSKPVDSTFSKPVANPSLPVNAYDGFGSISLVYPKVNTPSNPFDVPSEAPLTVDRISTPPAFSDLKMGYQFTTPSSLDLFGEPYNNFGGSNNRPGTTIQPSTSQQFWSNLPTQVPQPRMTTTNKYEPDYWFPEVIIPVVPDNVRPSVAQPTTPTQWFFTLSPPAAPPPLPSWSMPFPWTPMPPVKPIQWVPEKSTFPPQWALPVLTTPQTQQLSVAEAATRSPFALPNSQPTRSPFFPWERITTTQRVFQTTQITTEKYDYESKTTQYVLSESWIPESDNRAFIPEEQQNFPDTLQSTTPVTPTTDQWIVPIDMNTPLIQTTEQVATPIPIPISSSVPDIFVESQSRADYPVTPPTFATEQNVVITTREPPTTADQRSETLEIATTPAITVHWEETPLENTKGKIPIETDQTEVATTDAGTPETTTPFEIEANPSIFLKPFLLPPDFSDTQNSNCSQKIEKLAPQILPNSECPCPPGEMKNISGYCVKAEISTFQVSLDSVCGHKMNSDIEYKIIAWKLGALLNHPHCIRSTDDNLVVVNAVCDDCAIDDFSEFANKNASQTPEVNDIKVSVSELKDAACYSFDLNDCDEKAQCIPTGLRYQCECLPGTSDLSNLHGRVCEGVVIANQCTKVLGVCILFWILLLLLLLLAACLFGYLFWKYCMQTNYQAFRKISEKYSLKRSKPSEASLESGRRTATTEIEAPVKIEPLKPIIGQPQAKHLTAKLVTPDEFHIMGTDDGKDVHDAGVEPPVAAPSSAAFRTGSQTEIGIKHPEQFVEKIETISLPIISQAEAKYQPNDPLFAVMREPRKLRLEKEVIKNVDAIKVEPEVQSPSSDDSGEATPTIWDSYQILGRQYIATGHDQRRHSVISLQQLINQRQVKEKVLSTVHSLPSMIEFNEIAEKTGPVDVVHSEAVVLAPLQPAPTLIEYESQKIEELPDTSIPPKSATSETSLATVATVESVKSVKSAVQSEELQDKPTPDTVILPLMPSTPEINQVAVATVSDVLKRVKQNEMEHEVAIPAVSKIAPERLQTATRSSSKPVEELPTASDDVPREEANKKPLPLSEEPGNAVNQERVGQEATKKDESTADGKADVFVVPSTSRKTSGSKRSSSSSSTLPRKPAVPKFDSVRQDRLSDTRKSKQGSRESRNSRTVTSGTENAPKKNVQEVKFSQIKTKPKHEVDKRAKPTSTRASPSGAPKTIQTLPAIHKKPSTTASPPEKKQTKADFNQKLPKIEIPRRKQEPIKQRSMSQKRSSRPLLPKQLSKIPESDDTTTDSKDEFVVNICEHGPIESDVDLPTRSLLDVECEALTLPSLEERGSPARSSASKSPLTSSRRSSRLPMLVDPQSPVCPASLLLHPNEPDYVIGDLDLDLPGPYVVPGSIEDLREHGFFTTKLPRLSLPSIRSAPVSCRNPQIKEHRKHSCVSDSIWMDDFSFLPPESSQHDTLPRIDVDLDLNPPGPAPADDAWLKTINMTSTNLKNKNFVRKAGRTMRTGAKGQTLVYEFKRTQESSSHKIRDISSTSFQTRPPWNSSILHEGELKNIPLNWNIERSGSYIGLAERRTQSVANLPYASASKQVLSRSSGNLAISSVQPQSLLSPILRFVDVDTDDVVTTVTNFDFD